MDAATRRAVRVRAENCCEYCLLREVFAPFPRFHVEHIRARKHGGTDALENLCLACGQYNLHKSSNLTGIDPETDEITILFHPRNHTWDQHFRFDGMEVVGLSAIGRTTVRVLNMNDDVRCQLRQTLIDNSEWP